MKSLRITVISITLKITYLNYSGQESIFLLE